MGITDILGMMLPLVLIVVLLGGTWYWVSRRKITNKFGKFKQPDLDIISVKSIMPKKYLVSIKSDDRMLLLGVTDNSITLLQDKEFNQSLINESRIGNEKINFQELLKKNLGIK